MTRQNLSHHLRKEQLEANFVRKIQDIFNFDIQKDIFSKWKTYDKTEPPASYAEEHDPSVPPGHKRANYGPPIFKEDLEAYLKGAIKSDQLTLLDEITLKLLGNTLSNAFLNEHMEKATKHIVEKVQIVSLYATEYLKQRMEKAKQLEAA